MVQDYLDTYRPRLAEAYLRTVAALDKYEIPLQHARGGLFIFTDLHEWIHHFAGSQPSPCAESEFTKQSGAPTFSSAAR
ncbi:hypothetical protein BDV19DRAFT_374352 [Aspergillus venezuelensis]